MSIKWMPSSNFKTPCLIVQLNSMAMWLMYSKRKTLQQLLEGTSLDLAFWGRVWHGIHLQEVSWITLVKWVWD